MAVCEQDRPAPDLTSEDAQLKLCDEFRKQGVLGVTRDRLGRIAASISLPEEKGRKELEWLAFAFLVGEGFDNSLDVVNPEKIFLVVTLHQKSSQKSAGLFYPRNLNPDKYKFKEDSLKVDEAFKKLVGARVLKVIQLFEQTIQIGTEWTTYGIVYDEMGASTSSFTVLAQITLPEKANEIPAPRADTDPTAQNYLLMKKILQEYLKFQPNHE